MTLTRSLVQEHAPTRGNSVQVYVARLSQGQQVNPVDQTLYAVAFKSTVTVSGVGVAADAYTLVFGTPTETYTFVYASGGNETIVDGLVALINADTSFRAIKLSATTFMVTADTTFTIANTGTTTPANLTASAVSGAAIAVAATSIPLAVALTGEIQAGQYLCFADENDVERLVKVTALAAVGATSITVEATKQALTAGMLAEYPPYLWDRTAADLDRSYTDSTVATFNTGGALDGVPTGVEKTMSLPGLYYYYNAAYQTALEAAELQEFIYVTRRKPAPNTAFTHGGITEGRAIVTSAPETAAQDGFMEANLEIAFRGPTTETPALKAS